MSSVSARVYVIEHVEPAAPREGLHDQRELGAKSPSCDERNKEQRETASNGWCGVFRYAGSQSMAGARRTKKSN